MQAANQFTPDQLIVAGRRAEAQGQPAYALQFYRYVADQFPASTEAYEARDALFRLTPATADTGPPRPQGSLSPATGYANAPVAQLAAPPSGQAFGDVRPVSHHPSQPNGAAAPSTQRPRAAKDPRRADKSHVPAADHGAIIPNRGYRIGRLVAVMLNTIGWLLLISSIAMVPLLISALSVKAFPKALKETIVGNLIAFGGGAFGALLIGLFAIFAAQVARAAFDTADATRALLESQSG